MNAKLLCLFATFGSENENEYIGCNVRASKKQILGMHTMRVPWSDDA